VRTVILALIAAVVIVAAVAYALWYVLLSRV
jgi:hypothetical protein